jgi:inhibitor of cysteine peptidase
MKPLVRPFLAALLLLVVVASIGCGGDAEAAKPVELTAEDNGSTQQLSVDAELVITLDSNVTTGFAWKLTTEPDPAVVDLVGSEYLAPETELVGAGGQEVWTFRATGEGSTNLTLTYERSSGETAGEPYTVTVEVG